MLYLEVGCAWSRGFGTDNTSAGRAAEIFPEIKPLALWCQKSVRVIIQMILGFNINFCVKKMLVGKR